MNVRIADKINTRTMRAVYSGQPVPYTQAQVRKACHRLRQADRAPYGVVVRWATPERWYFAGVRRGKFPWERVSKLTRLEGLNLALGDLSFAATTAADAIAQAFAAFQLHQRHDDRVDALDYLVKAFQGGEA